MREGPLDGQQPDSEPEQDRPRRDVSDGEGRSVRDILAENDHPIEPRHRREAVDEEPVDENLDDEDPVDEEPVDEEIFEYDTADEDDAKPAAARSSTGDKVRTAMRGVGQTLITMGVVVLLFIVYEAFITDIFTAQEQKKLSTELHKEWEDPTVDAPPAPQQSINFADIAAGDAFAIMRIPLFGPDYAQVVVEGTTNAALETGPGHYQGTAGPGEVGNFSIAGHRVGKGSPFLNLDKLKPGAPIVIETKDYWFVYRVIGNVQSGDFADANYPVEGMSIITPDRAEVIAPVPGDPSATPTQKLMTLTTCHPKFSAAERLIIHSYLDGDPLPKAQYPKPEDVPALKES